MDCWVLLALVELRSGYLGWNTPGIVYWLTPVLHYAFNTHLSSSLCGKSTVMATSVQFYSMPSRSRYVPPPFFKSFFSHFTSSSADFLWNGILLNLGHLVNFMSRIEAIGTPFTTKPCCVSATCTEALTLNICLFFFLSYLPEHSNSFTLVQNKRITDNDKTLINTTVETDWL